ncbi:MAG: hypothetical protein FJ044_01650 [Candidatus Cloacimonetes bacterium]|nr:hypothetical protein [Candidatus Cloacimonadota bacterium]
MKNQDSLSLVDFRFPIGLGLFLLLGAAAASLVNKANLVNELGIYAYFSLLIGALVQIFDLHFSLPKVLKREVILAWLLLVLWLRVFINLGWLNPESINKALLFVFFFWK